MLPTRQHLNKYRFGTTTLLLLAWWFTSVTGTLINKKVMKQFPYPIAFTSLHLLIGALLDYIIIRNGSTSTTPPLLSLSKSASLTESSMLYLKFHLQNFKICAINGLFFSMAKYLTYLSYRQVPVSLTHTIKSMSPVFTVISQLIIFRHCVPLSELLTLLPIIMGVTLSTVTEIHFELVGFLAAVCSTLLGVAQNTTSKYILTQSSGKPHKRVTISPMQLHMYGSLLSLVFLIPLSMYNEAPSIYAMHRNAVDIPYYPMLMSCCWLYGQTMASLFLLKRVTTVTHNVANTCKRFWIIMVSIVYFKQETTVYNVMGIVLALSGFYLYQRMHKLNNKKSVSNKLHIHRSKGKQAVNSAKLKNGLMTHRNTSHEHRYDVVNVNIHDDQAKHRKEHQHGSDDDDGVELGETVSLLQSNESHDQ